MKTLISILTTAVLAASMRAETLDCKVFRLSGDMPAADEISRLAEASSLVPVLEFSATLKPDGSFIHKDQKTLSSPSEFSDTGEPSAFSSRLTGVSLIGASKINEGSYTLNYDFQYCAKKFDLVYLHKTGRGMPQPVFETSTIKGSASASLNTWTVVQSISDQADDLKPFYAVLLRVHD